MSAEQEKKQQSVCGQEQTQQDIDRIMDEIIEENIEAFRELAK